MWVAAHRDLFDVVCGEVCCRVGWPVVAGAPVAELLAVLVDCVLPAGAV